jgi:predicted GNAT family acetyltransferase
MVIGEALAVTELWEAAQERLPRPREDRPGQPVFVIRTPPDSGETKLRPATLDDLDLLLPACAAAHEQELGLDPLARDAEGFRWRTRSQIEDERSWLWVEDGVILFKAEASAWTPEAVQLQQVWVDPSVRRRGYGARGLGDLCRLLLESVTTVCLFVRAENAPAIRLYETIGMEHTLDYRSLLF